MNLFIGVLQGKIAETQQQTGRIKKDASDMNTSGLMQLTQQQAAAQAASSISSNIDAFKDMNVEIAVSAIESMKTLAQEAQEAAQAAQDPTLTLEQKAACNALAQNLCQQMQNIATSTTNALGDRLLDNSTTAAKEGSGAKITAIDDGAANVTSAANVAAANTALKGVGALNLTTQDQELLDAIASTSNNPAEYLSKAVQTLYNVQISPLLMDNVIRIQKLMPLIKATAATGLVVVGGTTADMIHRVVAHMLNEAVGPAAAPAAAAATAAAQVRALLTENEIQALRDYVTTGGGRGGGGAAGAAATSAIQISSGDLSDLLKQISCFKYVAAINANLISDNDADSIISRGGVQRDVTGTTSFQIGVRTEALMGLLTTSATNSANGKALTVNTGNNTQDKFAAPVATINALGLAGLDLGNTTASINAAYQTITKAISQLDNMIVSLKSQAAILDQKSETQASKADEASTTSNDLSRTDQQELSQKLSELISAMQMLRATTQAMARQHSSEVEAAVGQLNRI